MGDERMLVTDGEFAGVLAATRREGSTLSMAIRDLWDQETVRTAAKTSPAKATRPHVSIIGHITSEELRRGLTTTEKANGFANRSMLICVRRARCLPFGGDLGDSDLRALAERVHNALSFTKDIAGSLQWSMPAKRATR